MYVSELKVKCPDPVFDGTAGLCVPPFFLIHKVFGTYGDRETRVQYFHLC